MTVPIGRVFEFFDLDAEPQLPFSLLLGRKAMAGLDYQITWGEFGCCAFYDKLRQLPWARERLAFICSLVYPAIKNSVADLAEGRTNVLVVLVVDNEYLLVGENLLFDMTTGQQLDKSEYEKRADLMQVSVCFLVSSIVVLAAQRFLKEEPSYARDCPLFAKPVAKSRAGKS